MRIRWNETKRSKLYRLYLDSVLCGRRIKDLKEVNTRGKPLSMSSEVFEKKVEVITTSLGLPLSKSRAVSLQLSFAFTANKRLDRGVTGVMQNHLRNKIMAQSVGVISLEVLDQMMFSLFSLPEKEPEITFFIENFKGES